MNSFLGPFLMGFATCGVLVIIIGAAMWLGAKIATQKKSEPQG